MKKIDDKTKITDEQAMNIYKEDNQAFDNYVQGKTKTLNFERISRLVLSELALNKSISTQRILGYTRKQIMMMAEHPEHYGLEILKLTDYMYQKSGYMRRLVDYFSNMAQLKFYVDTEVLTKDFFGVKDATLKKNYIAFSAQGTKFNLSNCINEILKRLYLNDVCYAYVVETELDVSYYFINPRYCKLRRLVNGNVYGFALNRDLMSDSYIESLPAELQKLLIDSYETSLNNLVDIPMDRSLCIKYNSNFLHLFPPLFPMIADILLVEEYKDLAKSKAINDAYKLLVLPVPMKDGEVTMNDTELTPYVKTAVNVVQDNIGVLPYPGDVAAIEFSTSNSDDRDKVSDAVSIMYGEQGVSESLMSGASSGSELKLSITNDSGDIFRIYRMIENWVNLQMKLRNFFYKSYNFVYKIMDITTFNQSDVVDLELKMAQASIPNKNRLCAAAGFSPMAVVGNTYIENKIFKDVFDMWQPLRSSYTESSEDSENNGRPEVDDSDLSPNGENTRETDGNDPDNRI